MEQETNHIVFLCYGNERVVQECTYALLSLSRLYTPAELRSMEIWIYTDNPGWFRSFNDCPLQLRYREVDMATIKQWRGSIDFVHRVKIEVLKDLTKETSGNILYVDTDVVFTHRIDQVFKNINAGQLYMHVQEGVVSNAGNEILRKLNNYLKAGGKKLDGRHLHEMAMWNAGVLGFNTKHKQLLDEVLAFTDSEYPKFPKHIIEQFAFSVYFQQNGMVKAAAPYIFHYWKLKEAGLALASFFNYFKDQSWESLTRYSALVQMHTLMQEKVDFLHNRSLGRHLLKKQWLPAKHDWAALVQQM